MDCGVAIMPPVALPVTTAAAGKLGHDPSSRRSARAQMTNPLWCGGDRQILPLAALEEAAN